MYININTRIYICITKCFPCFRYGLFHRAPYTTRIYPCFVYFTVRASRFIYICISFRPLQSLSSIVNPCFVVVVFLCAFLYSFLCRRTSQNALNRFASLLQALPRGGRLGGGFYILSTPNKTIAVIIRSPVGISPSPYIYLKKKKKSAPASPLFSLVVGTHTHTYTLWKDKRWVN